MWSNAQPVALERALGPRVEQPCRQRKRGTIFGLASQDAPYRPSWIHGREREREAKRW